MSAVELVDNNDLEVIPRSTWCDKEPSSRKLMTQTPSLVHVTCTLTPPVRNAEDGKKFMKTLHLNHTFTIGYRDIAYNFIIGAEGEIYEGRGWKTKPERLAERIPTSEERLDIAYIGHFLGGKVPWVMVKSTFSILEHGLKHNLIAPNCKVKHMTEDVVFLI